MLTGIPKVHPNSLVPRELQCLTLSQPLPCLCSQNPKETSLFCVISLDPNISASPLSHPEVTSNRDAPKEQHRSITKVRGELREFIWICQLCFQAGSLYPRLEVTSQRGLSWKCCWTLQCSGPGRCSRSPRP